MSLFITNASVMVVVVIVFTLINYLAAKPNGNILLGVTLPYEVLKDNTVIEILTRFKKSYIIISLIFLLLVIPVFFIYEIIWVSTGYLLIWICVYGAVVFLFISKYFYELYALKQKNKWWVGQRNILTIDTEVSRLKNGFPVSIKWYLIPFVITFTPVVLTLINGEAILEWSLIIVNMFIVLLFFCIHFIYSKSRSITYCDDTSINFALNQDFKREWSKCIIMLAILNSVFLTALYFLLYTEGIDLIISVIASTVFPVLMIIVVFNTYIKIRRERNKMLRLQSEEVCTDDDIYWIGGIFYNNPNDGKIMVEKRIGIGMTVNIGTLGGKLIIVAVVLLFFGLMGSAIFMG